MQKNRGLSDAKNLANGPGKLAQAFGIFDTSLSGEILNKSSIYLEEPAEKTNKKDIIIGPRVGISKAVEVDARFYIKNNKYVSSNRLLHRDSRV